jgi:hypothetical protein
MLDRLLGGRGNNNSHDAAIEDDILAAELDPFSEITHADHTDLRPDPPLINGRRPDEIRLNTLTGQRTIVEKETHPETRHSREQVSDLRAGALERGWGFEFDDLNDDGLWEW